MPSVFDKIRQAKMQAHKEGQAYKEFLADQEYKKQTLKFQQERLKLDKMEADRQMFAGFKTPQFPEGLGLATGRELTPEEPTQFIEQLERMANINQQAGMPSANQFLNLQPAPGVSMAPRPSPETPEQKSARETGEFKEKKLFEKGLERPSTISPSDQTLINLQKKYGVEEGFKRWNQIKSTARSRDEMDEIMDELFGEGGTLTPELDTGKQEFFGQWKSLEEFQNSQYYKDAVKKGKTKQILDDAKLYYGQ